MDIMLVFSHITDLRASLPSNKYSRFPHLRGRVVLAIDNVDYTISPSFIFTRPESYIVARIQNINDLA
jgi:hypothetical protein